MNLHSDKDAFRVLIEDIHAGTGYRTDVLEKDYYVALILNELSSRRDGGYGSPTVPAVVCQYRLIPGSGFVSADRHRSACNRGSRAACVASSGRSATESLR